MNLKQLIKFGLENSSDPVIKNPVLRSALQEPRSMDQAALVDDLEPGSLKDEMLKDFDPSQETYEEYLQRKSLERPFNMAQGGQLVAPSVDGSRPGYSGRAEKLLTSNQQQKIKDAFPDIKFNFTEDQKFGVKKYLESKKPGPDTRKVNKDYTKVARFIKKGYKKEMGEGLSARGTPYQKEGKRLSIADQNKIMAKYDLPEGVKEWDFVNNKYGIKQAGREKLLKRIAATVADKSPWTLAADFGSTKGWMLAQMERVWKNESKNPNIKKLTYKPIYEKINGVKRIIGFKDNTVAGGGKTYYGLNKYTKKKAGDWTKHGDWKLNQKLVDISKRSGNAPNEVITGLLKKRGFTGKVTLNNLIHFLSGTEGTSQAILRNAIVKHHQSGVAFGSATNDLALTTQVINQKINKIEERIRANNILPDDIQTLKNNNIYVRHQGKLYGGGSKTPIGQFKQIESSVAKALETGKDFTGKDFTTKQLTEYLTQLCPKGKGKASGGRIGYKAAGAVTGTLQCGINELDKYLKKGVPETKRNLVARILNSGKNLIKGVGQTINPVEFFKLKNWIGKPAAIAMGAFETGMVLDDVLRKGKPLNQSLAENWIFGNVLDMDAQVEEAKNMLDNPNLSPAAKNYAQSIIDIKRYEDLENKLGWKYGETARKEIESEMNTIRHNVIHGGETGRFDYESVLADKQDARSAGEYVGEPVKRDRRPGWWAKDLNMEDEDDKYKWRKVNEYGYAIKGKTFDAADKIESRPMKAVVEPTAKRDYFKTLFDMPPSPFMADRGTVQMVPDLRKPVEPDLPVTREEVNRFYQDLGYVHPIGGEVPKEILDEIEMEEKTKYWSQLMDQERMRPLGKFAQGGRASYMGGGIAGIRRPHAIPPERGGLRSIMINGRKS